MLKGVEPLLICNLQTILKEYFLFIAIFLEFPNEIYIFFKLIKDFISNLKNGKIQKSHLEESNLQESQKRHQEGQQEQIHFIEGSIFFLLP